MEVRRSRYVVEKTGRDGEIRTRDPLNPIQGQGKTLWPFPCLGFELKCPVSKQLSVFQELQGLHGGRFRSVNSDDETVWSRKVAR